MCVAATTCSLSRGFGHADDDDDAPIHETQVLFEERSNGVAIITLNVPDKFNALSADMGDAFLEVSRHGHLFAIIHTPFSMLLFASGAPKGYPLAAIVFVAVWTVL